MVVYIDEYFLINLYIDLIIIIISSKIRNYKRSRLRIILTSFFASTYSVIVLVMDFDNGIMEMVFTYIVMSVLITIGAFGFINPLELIKNIICIFIVTFTFCGIINGIYSKNIITDNFSLLVVVTVTATIVIMVANFLNNNKLADENIVNVELFMGSEMRRIRALVDTGNSLCEPITGKPVSVIRDNVISINDCESGRVYVIPFKSIGKEKGVLTGYRIDKIKVYIRDRTVEINKPILAIYKGFFSERNEYDMILHPKIIKEGENNV